MGSYLASVAAAVAVVDANLFADEVWSRAPYDRVLTGIGVRGSAAALDTEFEVFIDEVRVGNFFNVSTGVPNNDDLLELEDLDVPAGAQLRAIVRDAATTNPINVLIALEDAEG